MELFQKIEELAKDAQMFYEAGLDKEAEACIEDIEYALADIKEELER